MRMRPYTIAAVLLLTGAACHAYPVSIVEEKVVVANIEAYLKTHPDDARAHLSLGIVHMQAWATGAKNVQATKGSPTELPMFMPWSSVMLSRHPRPPVSGRPRFMMAQHQPLPGDPTPEEIKSLTCAIAAYRNAVKLDPTGARAHLALACAYEELATAGLRLPADFDWGGGDLTAAQKAAATAAIPQLASPDPTTREAASRTLLALPPAAAPLLLSTPSDDPELQAHLAHILKQYSRTLALPEYREAYSLAKPRDLLAAKFDPEFDQMISAEAGETLLAFFADTPALAKDDEPAAITAHLDILYKKEMVMHVY